MALSHRVERIAEQIREELSQILATEVSDPGVGLVTITRVKVTADLSLARAYWTVLGEGKERTETAKALNRAIPYLRHLLSQRLTLRRAPELKFQYDESVAAHDRIERIIQDLHVEREAHPELNALVEAPAESDARSRAGGEGAGPGGRRRAGRARMRSRMSLHSSPPPELIAAIHRGHRFYVTSHQRPDGDAIGSAVGMALALQALGKQVTVVMDAVPPSFLQPFPHVDAIRATTEITDTADAVLVMECSSLARTGIAGLDRSPVINIDHHPGNTTYGTINWIDERAAACGEQVFTLIDALGVPLSAEIATHLYLAILTDTGSFHFSHLTPRTYELAARAVAAGADPQWIARTHYDSNSLARVRIFGAVLNGMTMHADGRVALLTITKALAARARRHLRRHRGADQLPPHREGRAGGGVLQGVGARRLARQPALQGRGRHRRDRQAVRRRWAHRTPPAAAGRAPSKRATPPLRACSPAPWPDDFRRPRSRQASGPHLARHGRRGPTRPRRAAHRALRDAGSHGHGCAGPGGGSGHAAGPVPVLRGEALRGGGDVRPRHEYV